MKDTAITSPVEEVSNMFSDMLRKHRKGHALDKASTKLREALIASRDTGAKSTVTVTTTITPGNDGLMTLSIQITSKLLLGNCFPGEGR